MVQKHLELFIFIFLMGMVIASKFAHEKFIPYEGQLIQVSTNCVARSRGANDDVFHDVPLSVGDILYVISIKDECILVDKLNDHPDPMCVYILKKNYKNLEKMSTNKVKEVRRKYGIPDLEVQSNSGDSHTSAGTIIQATADFIDMHRKNIYKNDIFTVKYVAKWGPHLHSMRNMPSNINQCGGMRTKSMIVVKESGEEFHIAFNNFDKLEPKTFFPGQYITVSEVTTITQEFSRFNVINAENVLAGTLLDIVKIIKNASEGRIRGQLDDERWISIYNLDNGYTWVKPVDDRKKKLKNTILELEIPEDVKGEIIEFIETFESGSCSKEDCKEIMQLSFGLDISSSTDVVNAIYSNFNESLPVNNEMYTMLDVNHDGSDLYECLRIAWYQIAQKPDTYRSPIEVRKAIKNYYGVLFSFGSESDRDMLFIDESFKHILSETVQWGDYTEQKLFSEMHQVNIITYEKNEHNNVFAAVSITNPTFKNTIRLARINPEDYLSNEAVFHYVLLLKENNLTKEYSWCPSVNDIIENTMTNKKFTVVSLPDESTVTITLKPLALDDENDEYTYNPEDLKFMNNFILSEKTESIVEEKDSNMDIADIGKIETEVSSIRELPQCYNDLSVDEKQLIINIFTMKNKELEEVPLEERISICRILFENLPGVDEIIEYFQAEYHNVNITENQSTIIVTEKISKKFNTGDYVQANNTFATSSRDTNKRIVWPGQIFVVKDVDTNKNIIYISNTTDEFETWNGLQPLDQTNVNNITRLPPIDKITSDDKIKLQTLNSF